MFQQKQSNENEILNSAITYYLVIYKTRTLMDDINKGMGFFYFKYQQFAADFLSDKKKGLSLHS